MGLAESDDDPDVMTPITFEEMRNLDSGFLGAMIKQITEDMFPNRRNGRR